MREHLLASPSWYPKSQISRFLHVWCGSFWLAWLWTVRTHGICAACSDSRPSILQDWLLSNGVIMLCCSHLSIHALYDGGEVQLLISKHSLSETLTDRRIRRWNIYNVFVVSSVDRWRQDCLEKKVCYFWSMKFRFRTSSRSLVSALIKCNCKDASLPPEPVPTVISWKRQLLYQRNKFNFPTKYVQKSQLSLRLQRPVPEESTLSDYDHVTMMMSLWSCHGKHTSPENMLFRTWRDESWWNRTEMMQGIEHLIRPQNRHPWYQRRHFQHPGTKERDQPRYQTSRFHTQDLF